MLRRLPFPFRMSGKLLDIQRGNSKSGKHGVRERNGLGMRTCEATNLRETINHTWVGVECATSFHVGEVGATGSLQSFTIEEKFASYSVVGVELCQWPDGTVAHCAVITSYGPRQDSIPHFLDLPHHGGNILLE